MSRFVPIVLSAVFVAGVIAATPAGVQPSRGATWGYISLENVLEARDLRVAMPGAVAFDATQGALAVTDDLTGGATVVDTSGSVLGTSPRRDAPRRGPLTARDAATGHSFTLDTKADLVVERDGSGAVVSRRDVAALRLTGVGGMAVAPTADTTDVDTAASLYVSVTNASDDGSATGPGVLELALTEPVIAASLASVSDNVGHLVQTIDASTWDPFSPDPSGIAYASAIGKLVVVDGEIEEESVNNYPYPGQNVWHVDPLTGAGDGIMDTTVGDPINREPVGAAYDPVRDELYISRDGSSSAVWAYTRNGDAWELRNQRTVTGFGVGDAEGLAFGNGNLYIGDGSNKEIWVIGPGPDAKVATADDILVDHFDTQALGINDPEGVGVDPTTGNVWILSHKDGEPMVETLPDGTPVSTTHFDFPTDNPGGLEIAPSSSTADDPSTMSAWIAQRGVDNNADPNEIDGKLFEVSIEAGPPPPPPPDPGQNLLTNGDFESGTLGGSPPAWTPNPSFTTSDASVNGGSFSGRHFSTAEAGYKIEQDVGATAGTSYNFSAWANRLPTTDAFKVVLKVQWRTASKAITTVTIGKITKATPEGWRNYVRSLVAPAGTVHARVSMVVSSLTATVYVDDIVLVSAP